MTLLFLKNGGAFITPSYHYEKLDQGRSEDNGLLHRRQANKNGNDQLISNLLSTWLHLTKAEMNKNRKGSFNLSFLVERRECVLENKWGCDRGAGKGGNVQKVREIISWKRNSSRVEGRMRQEDLKRHCGEVMRERDRAKNTV